MDIGTIISNSLLQRIQNDSATIRAEQAAQLKQNTTAKNISIDTNTVNVLTFSEKADNTYVIDNVSFSKSETEQIYSLMKSATDSIGMVGGTLDYMDYAKMSIAENKIKNFAEKNLTSEQADVLGRVIENYNKSLMKSQQKIFAGNEYKTDENAVYYGVKRSYNDTEIAAINELIDKMNSISSTKRQYVDANFSSVAASASNQTLIENVTKLFSDVDLGDSLAVENAMTQYKVLLTPAYLEKGITTENGALDRVLNKECSSLRSMISSLYAAENYRKLNLLA